MTEPASHLKQKLGAEFLGTFALVFIGAGSVIMESHTGMSHLGLADGKVSLVGIALAHGLTLAAMIYALGSYSGGHFNPAVSFAVWTRGGLRSDQLVAYVLAQLAAAAAAGLLLAGIFPDEVSLASLGTPLLPAKISLVKGGVIEAVITFLLVSTVLFVTRDENQNRAFAGLAIGATLVGAILFAGPVTGGSANPARYLGPALAAGKLDSLPAHVLGPLVGAAFASAFFWFLHEPSERPATASLTAGFTGEPSPAAAEGPGGMTLDCAELVEIARTQFESGHWKEAAQALVPIFWQFDTCDREQRKQVASLLLVIEAEAGKLDILDPYRSLVFARSSDGPAESG